MNTQIATLHLPRGRRLDDSAVECVIDDAGRADHSATLELVEGDGKHLSCEMGWTPFRVRVRVRG